MKVVVVSPHLDDAVFSLGASMSALRSAGVDVSVVTVFAGDPADQGPASYHDLLRGVNTVAEACTSRRAEDTAACVHLDVVPQWADNNDSSYLTARDPTVVWGSVAAQLDLADTVLVPGWPLTHVDHSYATLLALRHLPGPKIGFYSELPYAAVPVATIKAWWRGRRAPALHGADLPPISWLILRPGQAHWAAKRRAVAEYRGELAALGLTGKLGPLHDRLLRHEVLAVGDDSPIRRVIDDLGILKR